MQNLDSLLAEKTQDLTKTKEELSTAEQAIADKDNRIKELEAAKAELAEEKVNP